MLLGFAAMLAALSLCLPVWSPEPPDSLLSRIPRHLAGWTGNSIKLDTEFLGSIGFSNRVYKAYEQQGERV